MKPKSYDVVIVGAGPAGIFAALELSRKPGLRVAILDKGPDIDRRHCPAREPNGHCRNCQPCAILTGWGGAGAFSDGKLTLSPAVGGHLTEILGRDRAARDPAAPGDAGRRKTGGDGAKRAGRRCGPAAGKARGGEGPAHTYGQAPVGQGQHPVPGHLVPAKPFPESTGSAEEGKGTGAHQGERVLHPEDLRCPGQKCHAGSRAHATEGYGEVERST